MADETADGDKNVQVQVEILASGATADVVAWGEGQVLKLFREKAPYHAHEVAASQAAYRAGVLAPEVTHGLIEIDGREGIVFERVDGPTMAEYIAADPQRALRCGEQMAAFHWAMHSRDVSGILDVKDVIEWGIDRASDLDDDEKERVRDLLAALPDGGKMVHGDLHPRNIIMAGTDEHPVAIDWATGARGNPLADFARSWLLSRLWLQWEPDKPYWNTFWQVYLHRYLGACEGDGDEIGKWKTVVTAASLGMDGALAFVPQAAELRLSYVQAMLDGETHYWS
jgi:tRNA A-37 threonylcarbamoyl transferase component Bud32